MEWAQLIVSSAALLVVVVGVAISLLLYAREVRAAKAVADLGTRLEALLSETRDRAAEGAQILSIVHDLALDIETWTRQIRHYVKGSLSAQDLLADLNDRLAPTGQEARIEGGRVRVVQRERQR